MVAELCRHNEGGGRGETFQGRETEMEERNWKWGEESKSTTKSVGRRIAISREGAFRGGRYKRVSRRIEDRGVSFADA